MKLWLLRHGEAQPYQRSDAERQLTDYGRAQVSFAAQQCPQHKFDYVLCSPYIRARQTAEVFLGQLNLSQQPQIVPWLTPDSPLRESLRLLDSYSVENLLLISHQPLLGNMASWLEHGYKSPGLPLATASLACLQGDFLAASSMTLLSLQHANI